MKQTADANNGKVVRSLAGGKNGRWGRRPKVGQKEIPLKCPERRQTRRKQIRKGEVQFVSPEWPPVVVGAAPFPIPGASLPRVRDRSEGTLRGVTGSWGDRVTLRD